LYLETLERLFEKNFLNKKFSIDVEQHFGNIFLLRQQIPTKTTNVGKLGLLLLVVATNFLTDFCFIILLAATHRKNCLNMK